MINCKNIYQNDLVMAVNMLAVITVMAGGIAVIIDTDSSIPSVFASSNSTNDVLLNKTQGNEEMIFKLLFSSNNDNHNQSSTIKSETPILEQTDYNTNFKILPNITGMLTEEVPFLGNGTIKGVSYNHTGFFSGIWNSPHNILQYHGAVELITVDGDKAYYSVQGLSKIDSNGDVIGNGLAFFNTNSTGHISSLDGIKIYYEDKITNPTASDSPHRIIGWKIE
jgi:hypothetical protein